MRSLKLVALLIATGSWVACSSTTRADGPGPFRLLGDNTTIRAASDGAPAATITPVRWGRGLFGGLRGTDTRPNSGYSQANRDFWRGPYGSRTFSYGGVYARPGYAPGPL